MSNQSFYFKMWRSLKRHKTKSRVVQKEVYHSGFEHIELPALPDIRGMITEAERRYLFWLTSQWYTGRGHVVELGSWLGCSSIHLAAGLISAHHKGPLYCIDHFQWAGGAGWNNNLPPEKHMEAGADFMPLFLENIRNYNSIIHVKRSKISDLKWSEGIIEILFLDAPKQFNDISASLRAFHRALKPGLTLLVWQDYLHPASYAIPVALDSISDCLELMHVVTKGKDDPTLVGGNTVSFLLKKKPSMRRLSPDKLNQIKSSQKVREIWNRILPQLPEEHKKPFELGKIMALCQLGQNAEVETLLEKQIDDPASVIRLERWKEISLRKRYKVMFDKYDDVSKQKNLNFL